MFCFRSGMNRTGFTCPFMRVFRLWRKGDQGLMLSHHCPCPLYLYIYIYIYVCVFKQSDVYPKSMLVIERLQIFSAVSILVKDPLLTCCLRSCCGGPCFRPTESWAGWTILRVGVAVGAWKYGIYIFVLT